MLGCWILPSFLHEDDWSHLRSFFFLKKKKLENMIEKAQSEQGREYPQGSQGQAGMSHVEQGARF